MTKVELRITKLNLRLSLNIAFERVATAPRSDSFNFQKN